MLLSKSIKYNTYGKSFMLPHIMFLNSGKLMEIVINSFNM